MGRKHKNASPREAPQRLSLSGVRVHYPRPPSLALDTSGLSVWQHSVLLSAALAVRGRFDRAFSVTDDPYGVWRAFRFPCCSAQQMLTPDFSPRASAVVNSEIRAAVRAMCVARGFSQEMTENAVSEVGYVPVVLSSFWYHVSLMVGSFLPVRDWMLREIGAVRPVWTVDHKVQKQYTRDLSSPFVLIESGLRPSSQLPLIQCDPVREPHRFYTLAAHRLCRAAIARSHDGVVLGWAASDRCYQAFGADSSIIDVIMPDHLRLSCSEGVVDIPPDLVAG